MALLIWGMPCQLCGQPMLQGHDVVGFSAFVGNDADPLIKFSDGAFHRECFERDPLADAAVRRYEALRAGSPIGTRRCRVCGELFTEPDDHFSTFHLTDDTSSSVASLNYHDIHISCLPQWGRLAEVHAFATSQVESGTWRGRGVQWFVDTLSEALKRSASK